MNTGTSLFLNGMSSVKISHFGGLVSSAFSTVGTIAIIRDNHVGRNHAANNIDTKFDGVNTKFDGVNTKLDGVNTKLDGINREMRICQYMIERCQSSGGADCSSISKVEGQ